MLEVHFVNTYIIRSVGWSVQNKWDMASSCQCCTLTAQSERGLWPCKLLVWKLRSHECESCLIGCSQISGLGCGFICCLSNLRPKLWVAGGVHLCHGTGMLPALRRDIFAWFYFCEWIFYISRRYFFANWIFENFSRGFIFASFTFQKFYFSSLCIFSFNFFIFNLFDLRTLNTCKKR